MELVDGSARARKVKSTNHFPELVYAYKTNCREGFRGRDRAVSTRGVCRTRHLNAIVANSAARAPPSLQGLETATAAHAM